jgi:DNA-binding CsgD family transcriptional regulator
MSDQLENSRDPNAYLRNIRDLIEHMDDDSLTPAEICEYLVKHTFSYLSCTSVFMSRLDADGLVKTIADFGLDQQSRIVWTEVPLSQDYPVCDAIIQDDIVWIAHYLDMWTQYPAMNFVQPIPGMESFVVLPIDTAGKPKAVVGALFTKTLEPDRDIHAFLWTTASIISLYLSRISQSLERSSLKQSIYLTIRQKQILRLIADGYTNSQIATQLGFSESTIRHETMRLYRMLQVGGRKEAIEIALRNDLLSN